MSIFGSFLGGYQPPQQQHSFNPFGGAASTPAGPSEKIEHVESEILAWRGWGLDGDVSDPTLLSFNGNRWDGPTLTADKVPEIGSSHGVYALKVQDNGDYFSRAVYGQVALTGIVVEGELGYRAERATIRSLWIANPDHRGEIGERYCAWEIAGALEQKYEVEVLVASRDWKKWRAEQELWAAQMRAQQQYYNVGIGAIGGMNVLGR